MAWNGPFLLDDGDGDAEPDADPLSALDVIASVEPGDAIADADEAQARRGSGQVGLEAAVIVDNLELNRVAVRLRLDVDPTRGDMS